MAAVLRLGLALLLAGCQAATGPQCQIALAAAVPFTVQSQHIAVTPLLNGQPTDMFVDTGAQMTVLTTAAAQRLGLRLAPLGYFEGVGGRGRSYGFVAGSLQIGRLHGRNFSLEAADLGLSSKAHPVDGLFGADFLAAYDVDIDVSGSRVVLYKPLGACTRPVTTLGGELYVVPLLARATVGDPRPHVAVEIAGKRVVALLDTGAPHSALFRDGAHRIGLDIAALTTDLHYHEAGVGPARPVAVRHVLTPVTVDDLTVTHLPVAIIDQAAPQDADMLLGMDFMSRVHTWFSFSSRNLILQYPPLRE